LAQPGRSICLPVGAAGVEGRYQQVAQRQHDVDGTAGTKAHEGVQRRDNTVVIPVCVGQQQPQGRYLGVHGGHRIVARKSAYTNDVVSDGPGRGAVILATIIEAATAVDIPTAIINVIRAMSLLPSPSLTNRTTSRSVRVSDAHPLAGR
jgi:hypothetical protein